MIGAPSRARPNATCPAIPPAPWHIGTPPIAAPARFVGPVETATDFLAHGAMGEENELFSSRIAMIALPSVSGTCGSARNIVPSARSTKVSDGSAKCGARRRS